MLSRLSQSFLPLPMPMTSFAKPCSKNNFVGTNAIPRSLTRVVILVICHLCCKSLRDRRGSTLYRLPCSYGAMYMLYTQISPACIRQNESCRLQRPRLIDLISVPVRTRPHTNVSSISYSWYDFLFCIVRLRFAASTLFFVPEAIDHLL